jgi:hypothetical protein
MPANSTAIIILKTLHGILWFLEFGDTPSRVSHVKLGSIANFAFPLRYQSFSKVTRNTQEKFFKGKPSLHSREGIQINFSSPLIVNT